tara:strand:- start:59 stop:769 length:711 start_codon:yes stop_codon:yes gene_type:complete
MYKKILIFTATYNEKENIENLILKIKANIPECHILIIDDNSPDGTSIVIENLKKKVKDLYLIKRKEKSGLDSAHKIAYSYALENDFDFLITMDADFSHDPIVLPEFLNKLNKNPFVLGSRYIEGGKCLMTGRRLIMSRLGNLMIKTFSKVNSNEFTNSYRGFNLKNLKDFNLNDVKNKGYSFFMGTLFELDQKKIPIKEIPIIFKDREKGESKIPKFEIIRTLKNLFIFSLTKFIK